MTHPFAHSCIRRAALAAVLGLALAGAARAADLRETGRRLAAELETAIVNVRVVITLQDGNDHAMEASGTVISPDGLTIVPLDSVDPMSMARRVRGASAGGVSTRVKELKLLVNKRLEVPATLVLRDEDLNIALLRPLRKPAEPMKCVDLANTAEPGLLEEVFVLARMGRVADREVGAMTGEIQAIVKKPRKFYVPSSELASGGYGVPIFNSEAKLVGIVVIRINIGAVDQQNDVVGIILPARDIKEFVAQAPGETPQRQLTTPKPGPVGPAKIKPASR